MKRKDTKTRQAEIVAEAISIIGETGVSGLTTARLAGNIGITEPSLYRHFRDKEAILSGVLDEIGRLIMDRAAVIAAEEGAPADRLGRIIANHADQVERRGGIPRLVFSEDIHVRYPALGGRLMKLIGRYVTTVSGLLSEGVADGSLRKDLDPADTSLTFISMLQFTAMKWSLSGFSSPLRQDLKRQWKTFKKMIQSGGAS